MSKCEAQRKLEKSKCAGASTGCHVVECTAKDVHYQPKQCRALTLNSKTCWCVDAFGTKKTSDTSPSEADDLDCTAWLGVVGNWQGVLGAVQR